MNTREAYPAGHLTAGGGFFSIEERTVKCKTCGTEFKSVSVRATRCAACAAVRHRAVSRAAKRRAKKREAGKA